MESTKLNNGPMHNPPEGFPFTPESAIRSLTEPASYLAFPYIAGLTVMNDKVARAVSGHSEFIEKPWSRFFGTVDAAIRLVFGDEKQSLETAQRIWEMHTGIENSNDMELQSWVLACVFHGLEKTQERWIRPLNQYERQDYYEDIRIFSTFFGIKPNFVPENVTEHDDYWQDTIHSDFILSTDKSIEMVQKVFRFESPKMPKTIGRIGQAVTVGFLEEEIQERSGINLNKTDERINKVFDVFMRDTYGKLPISLRKQGIPAYLSTRKKIASIKN
jgi:uncharacterized protein (DUF2236 family)